MRNLTRIAGILIFLLIAGCTSTNFPTDGSVDSWNQFGYVEAKKGYSKKDQDYLQLSEQTLFDAYSKGYEKGRAEFCEQDAYKLGIMGKPYTGICDELDWRFRMRYNDGRSNQSLGRL
ncbi:DUF2799 domain-containing protein [Vibrio maritimus]|uniref:DUF2799 domain-containing protein n=1 Tax=Vibrio maritimus TaxID=990268 RepID=UPI001F179483|nr:DUF2799 domain-containing protein [Vibrio maritimus]